jgi:hypothetical protein
MADHATLVFFRSGQGDLGTAATALADRGLSVQQVAREFNPELVVGDVNGPRLRVAFLTEAYVQEEAAEIGEGTRYAADLGQCDARYEIMIDDLDAVLDETNTLIETQLTLQHATGGLLFNTWNGELAGPDDGTSSVL